MATGVWIVIAVAAVVVLALVLWSALRTRRTRTLREGFGPEYDRTVADSPSRREAETELTERQKRREELDIQPLSPEARDGYANSWRATQARFVDDPGGAIAEADVLIQRVMRERGYPVEDFRVAMVHYRSLFDELLESREPAGAEDPRQRDRV